MKKILILLLMLTNAYACAFEYSYDQTLANIEEGIRNTDIKLVQQNLEEMSLRESDLQHMLEFAQGLIDLRRIDVQAITDPNGRYSQVPPSVNTWLHRGLCLGSFVAAVGIIPLTIALLDTGHYANTEQDKIIIAAIATGSLLAMHGIYKIFNINTRIKNAILQRYIDALSIKQLLYRIPIKD